jgi:hypothetical protein
MDVPGDGNCLFYACISKLQNCLTFKIEQASNMRKYLMDYLLFHADDPSVSGNSDSLTWSVVMHYASEIQTELRQPFSQDAIISTLGHYAHYMSFANVNRCIYANAPELCLIACSYSLNIAVYQVDPRSSEQYVLIQEFFGDPMLPTAHQK